MDRRAFIVRSTGVIGSLAAASGWSLVRDATARTDPRLRELARLVRGPVLVPATPAFIAGSAPFNLRYERTRPLGVAQPLDARDVGATIRWARRHGVHLAARSGGHSYGGYSTSTGLVLDLSRLRRISVARGRATVGAGARLIDVETTLAAHGVAIPTGSCPTVGFGGLALGGGVGLASRAWGTTSDNVVEVELVGADGVSRVCNTRTHADLFWACRGGGGGNFGVVTRFTLRTHPASTASHFLATVPWSQAAVLVAEWQRFAPHAPDSLFSLLSLSAGRASAFGQFLGGERALREVLAPLRRVAGVSLTTGTEPYLRAQRRWANCVADCHRFAPTGFAAKSDYVSRPLSRGAIETMLAWIDRGVGSILLDSYGGALNRPRADATAFVHRDALFSMQYLAYWSGAGARSLDWLRGFHRALRPHVSGEAYVNYIDPELDGWQHAYYGSNLGRLREVKRTTDPDDVFHFGQSIRA